MTKNDRIVEISSDEDDTATEHDLIYRHHSGTVELNSESLKCLNRGSYLKDNIVKFYSAYLLAEVCPQAVQPRVHIFDSIFFERIEKIFVKEGLNNIKLKKLRKWYDNVDIFAKDFLIFPICSKVHWLLVIVCYPLAVKSLRYRDEDAGEKKDLNGEEQPKIPSMIILDSLGLRNSAVTLKIRDFLDFEWRFRSRTIKRFSHNDLKDYVPKVPKQKNDYDCGLYMLMYLRCFLEQPDQFYKLVRRGDPESSQKLRCLIKQCLEENDRETIRTLILDNCKTTTS